MFIRIVSAAVRFHIWNLRSFEALCGRMISKPDGCSFL